MAAKVVMVAVPTVLGVASIRVYNVNKAPADGLVTREKLNIYNPLPQPAQVHLVPENPGVIERGLTTVRESVQPFFQAVKGACLSVKTGSVNFYYAGEDVYYYLKDPPPGFLPRFGTITMAGLLGMVLARRGSRLKQLAVPLGLMGAGASVCYPAQAVAVLKVTGKKVYAAGQWSSAMASSLLTSKLQEPVDKKITASQPQSATVPNPETAVVEEASESRSSQRSVIQEPELESAESVPVSDESVVGVITEDASSVKLEDLSPHQVPTETITDPVVHLVPSEMGTITTSDKPLVPLESKEPSDTKQTPEEVSTEASQALSTPAETAPSSEEPPASRAPDEPAGGSGFKPDPALMDFGQSSPDDEDLYSTRS